MQRVLWIAVGTLLTGLVQGGEPEEKTRLERASALVTALQQKDSKALGQHFDENLNKLLDDKARQSIVEQLSKKLGALKKIGTLRADRQGGIHFVFVPCEFEKSTLDLRVAFDNMDRVSGFVLLPPASAFKDPPYSRKTAFREVELTIGAGGEWPLPATLSLPVGKGPFPVVVLVHGSGPHDRDETIAANKPFRDLAWGLASQDVAVLRFVKRTFQHGKKFAEQNKSFTVEQEVIEDALAALRLLRSRKEIDPRRIVLLGHSLGGMLAPRIAQAEPQIGGVIVLAGNTRPLEDLVIDQYQYLFGLQGKISEENEKRLVELRKQAEQIRSGTYTTDTPAADLLLGLPAAYWRDLTATKSAATAARLQQPLLILQGERDYQVTLADFAGWRKALADNRQATLKSYPNLNHLFMEGKGKSRPEEYQQAGHVAREVIDDIAAWVKKLPAS